MQDAAAYTVEDYRADRVAGCISRPLEEAHRDLARSLVDHMRMVDAFADDYAVPPGLCILFARQAWGPLHELAPHLDQLGCIERVLTVLELWGASSDEAFDQMVCTREGTYLLLIAEDVVAAAQGLLSGLPLAWLRLTGSPLLTPALLTSAPDGPEHAGTS